MVEMSADAPTSKSDESRPHRMLIRSQKATMHPRRSLLLPPKGSSKIAVMVRFWAAQIIAGWSSDHAVFSCIDSLPNRVAGFPPFLTDQVRTGK